MRGTLSLRSLPSRSRSQVRMDALFIDPRALRRAYRDTTLKLSDTAVHRRNVDGNTAAESCCICLEGLEIGEEVVIVSLVDLSAVFETCRCLTYQTSVDLLDAEISLAKAAARGNIADVGRLVEQGTQHSPRNAIDSTLFCRLRVNATQRLCS